MAASVEINKMRDSASTTQPRHNSFQAVSDRRMDPRHELGITTQSNNDEVHIVPPTWEIIERLLNYWS